MIRLAFKAISFFWIVSPIIFSCMRMAGVFDFGADWAVALFLTIMSTGAIFFNYKADE